MALRFFLEPVSMGHHMPVLGFQHPAENGIRGIESIIRYANCKCRGGGGGGGGGGAVSPSATLGGGAAFGAGLGTATTVNPFSSSNGFRKASLSGLTFFSTMPHFTPSSSSNSWFLLIAIQQCL